MAKNRVMMRTALRTDLKDSGALWSDAELNRCIERAVAMFTRFIPREKSYEETIERHVTDESVTSLATTSLTAIVTNADINVACPALLTISGQPDKPRPITLTLTDANNSAYGITVTVRGMDKNEEAQTEIFHWSRGDSKTIVGLKEFKYIYEVELTEAPGTGAADVLSIGYGTTYTGWIYLTYRNVRDTSVVVTNSGATVTYTQDTDYEVDYLNGRIRLLSGGSMAASTAYLVDYEKTETHIDLSSLPDLLRVDHVEYPVGQIPQQMVQTAVWGKMLFITGMGESDEQESLSEGENVRVYYDAVHTIPNDYTPGSVPEFLEDTVVQCATAYALLIYALKHEHQALTDLTSARTAIASLDAIQTAITTALTAATKYLNNNSNADAAGRLAAIATDAAALRTAIATALDLCNTLQDSVVTDLSSADTVKISYMGATHNYLDGGSAPDVKAYLDTADALLNTITEGGENEATPAAYANFAMAVKNALIATYEQDRAFYQQNATARTNAAMAAVQEASQRLTNLRTYIEESEAYQGIADGFNKEAEILAGHASTALGEAEHSISVANQDMLLADKFRQDYELRMDEVMSIWRDRKQYIGSFSASAYRQMK